MKSSRLIAFEIIYKIFYDSSYSNLALDCALKDIDDDKAFISALVYGVVERKITLDYFINKYVTSKPKPKILTILRLGAYQLLFMDKVPSSAAINESVKLTKDIKQDYYSKLVNAVLHKIDKDRQIPDDLSIKFSVPQSLISMWTKQYGDDATLKILNNINEKPPVYAIPNTLYVDADELLYELMCDGVTGEVVDGVVKINSSFELSKLSAYKNGLFHIEDLSCYECTKSLDAKEGDIILDICSAPGGKAFSIAEHIHNNGKLYCFDIHKHRVDLVKKGAERLGLSCINAQLNDATVFNNDIPMADRILCDVPCSGLGIIRRKPEIRYKELDSIKDLPDLQYTILNTSAKYLKPNGTLVYSTCTLNKKENEKVVQRILENNKSFKLEYDKTIIPSSDGGDGFYWAVLKYEN